MFSKQLITVCWVVAVATAAIHPYGAGSVRRQLGPRDGLRMSSYDRTHGSDNQEDTEPNYAFRYAVRDELAGDIKSQQEVRRGDQVRGQYRMLESDGTERIVDYTADDYRGFNAVVRHQPPVAVIPRAVHVIRPAAAWQRY